MPKLTKVVVTALVALVVGAGAVVVDTAGSGPAIADEHPCC